VWRPDLWLALLRVAVGALLLRQAWTHFALAWVGVVPFPGVSPRFLAAHGRHLAEVAAATPYPWHRDLLRDVLLPHATLAGTLQAWAELLVGIGLVLGFLAGLAALVGLVLAADTLLAASVAAPGPEPLHWLLAIAMLAFLGSRAGRAWGLDAWLLRRASRPSRVVLGLLL
jgi:thiosulfate dehydrogenase [quinone] large subunit